MEINISMIVLVLKEHTEKYQNTKEKGIIPYLNEIIGLLCE
jgi:hypothetical protein